MTILSSQLQEVRNLLQKKATTGSDDTDALRYQELRGQLISEPTIAARLPKCVLQCRELDEFWPLIADVTGTGPGTWAQRRQYLANQFNPLLDALERESRATPAQDEIVAALSILDSEHVALAWKRARERRSSDPAAAITSARSLLETVSKRVLEKYGESYASDASVEALYVACANLLGIAPQSQTETRIRQFYSACKSMVAAIGALRNTLGDAHGAGSSSPYADHALGALAVDLAGALVAFVAARFEEANAERSDPALTGQPSASVDPGSPSDRPRSGA